MPQCELPTPAVMAAEHRSMTMDRALPFVLHFVLQKPALPSTTRSFRRKWSEGGIGEGMAAAAVADRFAKEGYLLFGVLNDTRIQPIWSMAANGGLWSESW